MKAELSAFDLYFLVKEFQILADAKVQKIFQGRDNKKQFLFDLHVPSVGRKLLRVNLPDSIYFTEYKGDWPDTPPGYCMFLRKYLGSARIRAVRQHDFERILEMDFEGKMGKFTLIIELFSKGNMILLENRKIKSPLETQSWHDRTIRGGIEYEYPPAQANVPELSEQEFNDALKKSNKGSIVKALAIDLGLGGLYAEELCAIAEVDKDSSPSPNKKIFSALQKLLKKRINAVAINGHILPFKFNSIEGQVQKYESFNQALDDNLSEKIITATAAVQIKDKEKKLSKIQKILKQQELKIKGYEKSAEENQKKGELIFENYQLVKDVLAELRKAREKYSWAEIKEKLKGHKLIKGIDEKKGEITIEF